jgi:serine/threonine protein kinase
LNGVCSNGLSRRLEAGSQIDSYALKPRSPAAAWPPSIAPPTLRDNRTVALKIPHPDLEADPILFDRFQREAASAKSSTTQGDARLRRRKALPHLHGHGVVRRPAAAPDLDEGRMPQERAIRIAIGVLDALEYIHANGVCTAT